MIVYFLRRYVGAAADGMSIEITENGKVLKSGLKEAVKMFYGYAAAWLLRKVILSLHDIKILVSEILQCYP
ncbi:hypothetical protein G6F70_000130 [Rhizopus microsporus]|nr:hypothetical protein G6F71_002625 [Rhizopus microsporus]KAG1204824.1 hypothetical protein G6F70_000130 [Rhizopus microsporus]KAG1216298.1 hypothetical protein G6F69_000216 [Rhizopus microsporus]KAG1238852.1 hypothetical protein G6F67_000086 [Rhizopus microsporus]KAG1269596.1 hypothetical protein G6F68_000121 [Rhizopus microsporus]